MLRELLLRTVDSLTLPVVRAGRTSMAAAFVYPNVDQVAYLKRTAAIAQALDLGLEVVAVAGRGSPVARAHHAASLGGEMLHETFDPASLPGDALRASLVALPHGRIAAKLANLPLPYDLFIVGAGQTYLGANPARSPVLANCRGSSARRLRQAHRLSRCSRRGGKDLCDARPRAPASRGRRRRRCRLRRNARAKGNGGAARRFGDHPAKGRSGNGMTYREFDRDALIARKPQVALIDELAHTQRARLDRAETLLRCAGRSSRRHRRDNDAEHPTSRRLRRHDLAADRNDRP